MCVRNAGSTRIFDSLKFIKDGCHRLVLRVGGACLAIARQTLISSLFSAFIALFRKSNVVLACGERL